MSGVFGWMQRFLQELRRRRVIRVSVVYATTAFVVLQLAEILVEPFGLGDWSLRLLALLLVLGFPLAVRLTWVYNLTDEGLVRTEGSEETATEIGDRDCGRNTLYRAVDDGRLNAVMVGDRKMLVQDDEYEAFEPKETGARVHRNRGWSSDSE